MNNAMLQTHNLSVGYDKKILIQGIEIAVCPGEILTLIGPNGAGKSTIIKALPNSWKFWAARFAWRESHSRRPAAESWRKKYP